MVFISSSLKNGEREVYVLGGEGSHHMLMEIHDEPTALRETLNGAATSCRKIASELTEKGLGLVYFSGSGTSYHAALASHYLTSSLSNTPTNSLPASEFDSWVRATPSSRSALIIISQSGESVDALSAVEAAKRKGIRSVAITNSPRSQLAETSDFAILTRAGAENAVTATKTFLSCLAAAYLLSFELAEASASLAIAREELSALRQELEDCHRIVQETIIACEDAAKRLANRFERCSLFFLLGKGASYATALEGALKLKESCNVMAEGFAAREFLHGPMQLVDESTPVITIYMKSDYESLKPLMDSFRRLGTPIVRVSEPDIPGNRQEHLGVAGGLSEPLSPLAFIVPIQLFAYYSAISRGLDPDKPTKLTKVVR